MGEPARPRKAPCATCPYRRDVPPGVWNASEYAKLPPYDGETFDQPAMAFFCHHQDGSVCAGWAGCHDMRNTLGARLGISMGIVDPSVMTYSTDVPLWGSGAEAAAHGLSAVNDPPPEAIEAIDKIARTRRARGRRAR